MYAMAEFVPYHQVSDIDVYIENPRTLKLCARALNKLLENARFEAVVHPHDAIEDYGMFSDESDDKSDSDDEDRRMKRNSASAALPAPYGVINVISDTCLPIQLIFMRDEHNRKYLSVYCNSLGTYPAICYATSVIHGFYTDYVQCAVTETNEYITERAWKCINTRKVEFNGIATLSRLQKATAKGFTYVNSTPRVVRKSIQLQFHSISLNDLMDLPLQALPMWLVMKKFPLRGIVYCTHMDTELDKTEIYTTYRYVIAEAIREAWPMFEKMNSHVAGIIDDYLCVTELVAFWDLYCAHCEL